MHSRVLAAFRGDMAPEKRLARDLAIKRGAPTAEEIEETKGVGDSQELYI
jgi:hypothetical protein